MKFIMILISLTMISFGMIFLVATSDSGGAKKVKEKVGYDQQPEKDKDRIDNYMKKLGNRAFVAMVLGICLFIASLFL